MAQQQVVTLAVDLLAWTRHLAPDGDLAKAEPKHQAHVVMNGDGGLR